MKKLLEQVTNYSVEYLSSLKERRVGPSDENLKLLANLNVPLQDEPMEPKKVIKLLNDTASKTTIASAGGRYFGFVIGGSLPAALAANWLAGTWDQNAGLAIASPFAAYIEEICLQWLVELLPVSKESAAGFVTAVTTANFTAMIAARHSILDKQG